MNLNVDPFFEKQGRWQEAYVLLRRIVLGTALTEELKWGCPCYTYGKSNVVLIHGFKDYCALLFMKGALLRDEEKILVQQSPNVQSARQVRFTSATQVEALQATLLSYLEEAIRVEKEGGKVPLKKTEAYPVPEEFSLLLNDRPDLKNAFDSLTPGRQRAYLLYFSAPKQSSTREGRIERSIDRIMKGKGLND